jgi:hypothetical protein
MPLLEMGKLLFGRTALGVYYPGGGVVQRSFPLRREQV